MAYDIIFLLPYAFCDHPSFPEGILKRTLESRGFSTGYIETPRIHNPESLKILGKPNLFFAIIPGPVDSLLMNFTALHKRRHDDHYQPDGSAYFTDSPRSVKSRIRPDRTVIAYANAVKKVFKDVPIICGGIEASLRCFAHYDFIENAIRRSILLDSRCNMLVTGMGEQQMVSIARTLKNKGELSAVSIAGTATIEKRIPQQGRWIELPSAEAVIQNPQLLVKAFNLRMRAAAERCGIVQAHGNRWVTVSPRPATTAARLDEYYSYPYERIHPQHRVFSPALRMNLFSVTSHRGCGGGCSFCTISSHQGRHIVSRSMNSINREIGFMSKHPQWKGIISDMGGATAEMFGMDCGVENCRKGSCLIPAPCPNLGSSAPYRDLLKITRKHPAVRKVFVSSGIRYDLMLKNPHLLEDIMRFHSGEYLRVAPEHSSSDVLNLMRKPEFQSFQKFCHLFNSINRFLKRKIKLAAYVIIGHPGEHYESVRTLARDLNRLGIEKIDAQIFTPLPQAASTAMYVSGTDLQGRRISVARNLTELKNRKDIFYNSLKRKWK